MDITVYLPDALGERAKKADINLSRMLRDALTEEFEMSDAIATTLNEPDTFTFGLEDDEGRFYEGRITGAKIAKDGDVEVFLTEDERIIVVDHSQSRHIQVSTWEDPREVLRDWLRDDGEYVRAMQALGIKPVIDI